MSTEAENERRAAERRLVERRKAQDASYDGPERRTVERRKGERRGED